MKKVFIAIGIVVGLAIIAMSVAPFFFDINKHLKPRIVKALEENLKAKVKMGDIALSLFGKVTFEIDSLKIVKDALTVDVSELKMVMPYSVLTDDPDHFLEKIKMKISADELAINGRSLVVNKIKTDFLKENTVVKLKNTEFIVFDGKGTSYAEMEFAAGLKALVEFEIRDGTWPVDKLKTSLKNRVPNIGPAKQMVSDIDIDDRFESLKGNVRIQNGTTNIESLSMKIPANKAEAKASGTIDAKNNLKISGNFILPLDNVPKELRASDGRGNIPFEVLGTIDAPKVNWEKLIDFVVKAYSKDEGKKIIRKELEKLKDKLKKDEKLKEFIKGIKF